MVHALVIKEQASSVHEHGERTYLHELGSDLSFVRRDRGPGGDVRDKLRRNGFACAVAVLGRASAKRPVVEIGADAGVARILLAAAAVRILGLGLEASFADDEFVSAVRPTYKW